MDNAYTLIARCWGSRPAPRVESSGSAAGIIGKSVLCYLPVFLGLSTFSFAAEKPSTSFSFLDDEVPSFFSLSWREQVDVDREFSANLDMGFESNGRFFASYGRGETDLDVDPVDTTAYSFGLEVDSWSELIFLLSYDYWEADERFQSDTVSGQVTLYKGDFSIALLGEIRNMAYFTNETQSQSNIRVAARAPGAGAEVGFYGLDNVAFKVGVKEFDISTDEDTLRRWFVLASRSDTLRPVFQAAGQLATQLEERQIWATLNWSIRQLALGGEWQRHILAIGETEIDLYQVNASWYFSQPWYIEAQYGWYQGDDIDSDGYYLLGLGVEF